jgi:iron(III) transport system ATP-binding protein
VSASDPANAFAALEATAPTRIEVRGLSKAYGPKLALDQCDLVIEPGTFLVLLGPSGSGKSTFLRCLAGIERASTGSIWFGSRPVDGPEGFVPPEKRDLGMVFQDYALWPHMTAVENVAFALGRRRLASGHRRSLAQEALDQVGLSGLQDRYPGQLSGGEQQRVALARALVSRPGLLLFDEPLSNLDADRREQLRVDIGAMVRQQEATAVYITHDQAEAFALADQVGVLRDGRLAQLDDPERVYREPADEFVATFTGLAGELRGRVKGSLGSNGKTDGDHLVEVEVAGQAVPARVVGGERRLRDGSPARVLVRPFAVSLVAGDGPGADTAGVNQTRVAHLTAVVRDAAFRGSGYDHVVETVGGGRLSGIRHHQRMAFGSTVTVALECSGCLATPDPPASVTGQS